MVEVVTNFFILWYYKIMNNIEKFGSRTEEEFQKEIENEFKEEVKVWKNNYFNDGEIITDINAIKEFSQIHHNWTGQLRLGNKKNNFDVHIEGVAELVSGYGERYRAAALLHDIVEDTRKEKEAKVVLKDIQKYFGLEMRDMVESLTENQEKTEKKEEEIKNNYQKEKDEIFLKFLELSEEEKEEVFKDKYGGEMKKELKAFLLEDSLRKIKDLKDKYPDTDIWKIVATVRSADILQNTSDFTDLNEDKKKRNLEKINRIYQEFKDEIDLAEDLKDRIDEIEKLIPANNPDYQKTKIA